MPVVTVKIVEGSFPPDRQKLLIDGINDLFARVASDGIRPHMTVIVEEVRSGLWSRGGEILTLDGLTRDRKQGT